MKKILCLFISAIIISMCFLSAAPAYAAEGLNTGDVISFGSYPQSKVIDSTLIESLGALDLDWVSYDYTSGTGDFGTMFKSDFMKYADVTYNGEKYRAVCFTKYRPTRAYYSAPDADIQENTSESGFTHQLGSGYHTNTVYWFKFEPILWRVLNPDEGLVVSEKLLDSQPFTNFAYEKYVTSFSQECYGDASLTYYANNYVKSSIRAWLNSDGFYNTAFSAEDKAEIEITELENKAHDQEKDAEYNCENTNDKVFLLSSQDLVNEKNGFSPDDTVDDPARMAIGTDYAYCQGLGSSPYATAAAWQLRTPSITSYYACGVYAQGAVAPIFRDVLFTCYGVRPAIKLADLTPFDKVTTLLPYSVTLNYRKSATLTPTILNSKTVDNVEWIKGKSRDGSFVEDVITIDESGNIVGVKAGSDLVKCTVYYTDGSKEEDTCIVNVEYTFWQWIVYILSFAWIWG